MNKSLFSKFTLALVLAGSSVTSFNERVVDPIKLLSNQITMANKAKKNLEKIEIKEQNIIEDLSDFESLDFTPNYNVQNSNREVKEFHEVKKKKLLKPIAKIHVVNNLEKSELSSASLDDLNLSYTEYEDQGKVEYSKLPKIEVANFELNLDAYKVNTQNIAKLDIPEIKEINTEDRISTKVAATNESLTSSTLKLNVNSAKTTKDENPKANELVYFDYNNEGKVNVNEKMEEKKTEVVILEKEKAPEALVFFDYSEKTSDKKKTDKVTTISNVLNKKSQPISKVQKNKKPTKSKKPPKTTKTESQLIAMNTQKNNGISSDKISMENAGIQKAVAKLFADDGSDTCLEGKSENEYSYVDAKISLNSIGVKDINKSIHNFDMRMGHSDDAILQDFGTGIINLNQKMNGKMNVIRSRFFTSGHLPTVTDMVYEDAEAEIQIPSLSNEYIDNIVSKYNLKALGAYLLVELDNKTEDVELDQLNKYEAKFYLDSRYNIVDRGNSQYQFVLFIGAEIGNTTLYFKKTDNKVVSKLINLVEKEVYYEPNFYAEIDQEKFSLYEESLLTKCKSPLSLPAKAVSPWSFEGKTQKTTINEYSSPKVEFPLGTRKYYEVKGRDVYFGRWNQEAVVIPDEQYIEYIYRQFKFYSNECMLQINVEKEIAHFSYGAETGSDYLRSTEKFLDIDGHFYNNPSPNTKKIFIQGEGVGVFNINIEYLDGSTQSIQSFCGKDSYLIEQL